MSSLISSAFPGKTLYEILNVSRDVAPSVLKKAYYKAALQYHPDKAGTSAVATSRFQALSLAHSILADADRRREYDESGVIDDDNNSGGSGPRAPDGGSWDVYWRREFPAFDERDIDAFASRYRGSKEEEKDILDAYEKYEGDMDGVLDSVPCSQDADAERFAGVIHALISSNRVKPLPAFVDVYGLSSGAGGKGGASAKSRAAAARTVRSTAEAREAEEYLEKLKKSHTAKYGASSSGKGEPSLAEMMRRRAEEREGASGGFFQSLEDRYGGGAATKAKKKSGGGAMIEDSRESPKRKKKSTK
jgi:DnaJ family protein C protein 9